MAERTRRAGRGRAHRTGPDRARPRRPGPPRRAAHRRPVGAQPRQPGLPRAAHRARVGSRRRSRPSCHAAATTICAARGRRRQLDGLDHVHGVPITVDLADCGVRRPPRPGRRGQRRRVVDGHPGGVPAQPGGPHDRRPRSASRPLERLAEVVAPHPVGRRRRCRARTWRPRPPRPTSCSTACSRSPSSGTAGNERERRRPALAVDRGRPRRPPRPRPGRRGPSCSTSARTVGITSIWLADTAAEVPRQADEILVARSAPGAALVGTLWSTDPEVPDREVDVEQLRSDVADRVARALAPIRDASTASLATSIPRTAPLLDVLGVGMPSPDVGDRALAGRHRRTASASRSAWGPTDRLGSTSWHDGPHALDRRHVGRRQERAAAVDGRLARPSTTRRPGSTSCSSTTRAAPRSTVFGDLPHTVGYVTNLDAELSLRALTSLRAELNRRMRRDGGPGQGPRRDAARSHPTRRRRRW